MVSLQIGSILTLIATFIMGFSVHRKSATKIDLRVKEFVDKHKNPKYYKFFKNITRLANVETMFVLVLFVVGYFAYKRKYAEGTAILIGSFLASVASHGFKFIFKRRRPVIRKKLNYSGYSFPSGHSTIGVCFYPVLAYILYSAYQFPFFIIILAYILGLIIAFSRVYLSAHWFTDILFGVLLGTFCFFWVIYFYNRNVDIIEIFLKNLNFL